MAFRKHFTFTFIILYTDMKKTPSPSNDFSPHRGNENRPPSRSDELGLQKSNGRNLYLQKLRYNAPTNGWASSKLIGPNTNGFCYLSSPNWSGPSLKKSQINSNPIIPCNCHIRFDYGALFVASCWGLVRWKVHFRPGLFWNSLIF